MNTLKLLTYLGYHSTLMDNYVLWRRYSEEIYQYKNEGKDVLYVCNMGMSFDTKDYISEMKLVNVSNPLDFICFKKEVDKSDISGLEYELEDITEETLLRTKICRFSSISSALKKGRIKKHTAILSDIGFGNKFLYQLDKDALVLEMEGSGVPQYYYESIHTAGKSWALNTNYNTYYIFNKEVDTTESRIVCFSLTNYLKIVEKGLSQEGCSHYVRSSCLFLPFLPTISTYTQLKSFYDQAVIKESDGRLPPINVIQFVIEKSNYMDWLYILQYICYYQTYVKCTIYTANEKGNTIELLYGDGGVDGLDSDFISDGFVVINSNNNSIVVVDKYDIPKLRSLVYFMLNFIDKDIEWVVREELQVESVEMLLEQVTSIYKSIDMVVKDRLIVNQEEYELIEEEYEDEEEYESDDMPF